MSTDKIIRELVASMRVPRELGPEVFKSSEQRQAEWNEISSKKLLREQGRNLIEVIAHRVQALEAELKEGESLAVFCDAGKESILVRAFEFPTWHLAIVSGLDENGNQTYRIENIQDVKLTCKVVKSDKKAARIGFTLPPNQ